MEDKNSGKGLKMYRTPYLFDEKKPASNMDIPAENFIPTPTTNTDSGFSSYSLGKKITIISALVLVAAFVLFCGIDYFVNP